MTKTREGIFGGTFDPLHLGHINSMKTVVEKLQLDRLRVIPAHQSPHRGPTHGPTPEQRLAMVKAGVAELGEKFLVDDREIRRGGVSFTIDTLRDLVPSEPETEFYFIIGADQFAHFEEWRDYKDILSLVNLVVTSRPNSDLPESEEDLPGELPDMVEAFKGNSIQLITGKKIHFVQLDDVEVSATELRRLLRDKEPVGEYLPAPVEKLISKEQLYEPLSKTIGDFEKLIYECAGWLNDRKAVGVMGYDLRELDQPAEFTLIASGTSTRHTSGLAEHIVRQVKTKYGVFPQSTEGLKEGRWVVLDYGSLMVHLFYDFTRQEYRLEELWQAGKKMDV